MACCCGGRVVPSPRTTFDMDLMQIFSPLLMSNQVAIIGKVFETNYMSFLFFQVLSFMFIFYIVFIYIMYANTHTYIYIYSQ